jgi:hypothetical protein
MAFGKRSHTLWGGRFNSIVMADRPEEARQLIELYRADVVLRSAATRQWSPPAQFPHLIRPYTSNT